MAKSKQQQLDQIKQQIIDDDPVPALREGATQLVFGDGKADAEIVFIGEAPGKQEDIQGLPFVGAAGKFLNEMLEGIGLKRSDIYITNIVKYRPPENRDPEPEEKKAFLPYLLAQLVAIKPKLVVTLGRHSMEALIPGQRISECHGRPKRIKIRFGSLGLVDGRLGNNVEKPNYQLPNANYSTWVILPLFHPAAALYNGGMRQTLVNDFNKIPAILAKIDGVHA